MYFLFDEVGGQDGRFIADNYASFGWISAAVVAITALITLWGTRGFIRSTAALSSSIFEMMPNRQTQLPLSS